MKVRNYNVADKHNYMKFRNYALVMSQRGRIKGGQFGGVEAKGVESEGKIRGGQVGGVDVEGTEPEG
jgi:hypothetical protein